jgi:hypothetical protein
LKAKPSNYVEISGIFLDFFKNHQISGSAGVGYPLKMLFNIFLRRDNPGNEEFSTSTYPEHKILLHSDQYEASYGIQKKIIFLPAKK